MSERKDPLSGEIIKNRPSRVLQPGMVLTIEPAEDDVACVRITDTGPGIDPEVADRLFQPFITSKRTGMGVGLSICRTIVEAHGGRIWGRPNEDGGAEFGFTLEAVGKEALYDGQ